MRGRRKTKHNEWASFMDGIWQNNLFSATFSYGGIQNFGPQNTYGGVAYIEKQLAQGLQKEGKNFQIFLSDKMDILHTHKLFLLCAGILKANTRNNHAKKLTRV